MNRKTITSFVFIVAVLSIGYAYLTKIIWEHFKLHTEGE